MLDLVFPDRVEDVAIYVQAWDSVRTDALALFKGFSEKEFNTRPADGSWSPAEVTEHVMKVQSQFARAIRPILAGRVGEDVPAEFRPDYEAMLIRVRTRGVPNPGYVAPEGNADRAKLLAGLDGAMEKLKSSTENKSPDDLRTRGYRHQIFGTVSVLDGIWIFTLHEESHMAALKDKRASIQTV